MTKIALEHRLREFRIPRVDARELCFRTTLEVIAEGDTAEAKLARSALAAHPVSGSASLIPPLPDTGEAACSPPSRPPSSDKDAA